MWMDSPFSLRSTLWSGRPDFNRHEELGRIPSYHWMTPASGRPRITRRSNLAIIDRVLCHLSYGPSHLVPGAGFEPAAIPLCKRGGFDHSHHPGIHWCTRPDFNRDPLPSDDSALCLELRVHYSGAAHGTSTRISVVRTDALFALS